MKPNKNRLGGLCSVLGLTLITAISAKAQSTTNSTWIGGSFNPGGNWSVSTNWSNGISPTGTDAVANLNNNVNLDLSTLTLGTVSMNSGRGGGDVLFYGTNASNVLTLATSSGTPTIQSGGFYSQDYNLGNMTIAGNQGIAVKTGYNTIVLDTGLSWTATGTFTLSGTVNNSGDLFAKGSHVLPSTMDVVMTNIGGAADIQLLLDGGRTQTIGALSGTTGYVAGFAGGSQIRANYVGYGINAGSSPASVAATNNLAILNIGNTGANGTYSGSIGSDRVGGGTAASSLSIIKIGSGTQTFTGSNVYAGGTIISAGTLVAGSTNALGVGSVTVNSGNLQLSSATTVGGGLTLAGGNLDNAGNLLSLGTNSFTMSSGTLFDNLTSSILSGSGTFAITGGFLDLTGATINYTNSYTLFNGETGSVSGLTYLGYNTNYTPSISSLGVLSFTAVPEPSTFVLLGISGLFLVVALRRRNA